MPKIVPISGRHSPADEHARTVSLTPHFGSQKPCTLPHKWKNLRNNCKSKKPSLRETGVTLNAVRPAFGVPRTAEGASVEEVDAVD